jgi:hypothetical protein
LVFQASVRNIQAPAVVGEIFKSHATRVRSLILSSGGNEESNIIGRAFTRETSSDIRVAAGSGGGGSFAGIMIDPKSFSLEMSLNPSLFVPNGRVGYFATKGTIAVDLAAIDTGEIGEGIFYTDDKGVLVSGTAGAGQTQIPGAIISERNITAPGVAIISLDDAVGVSGGGSSGGNANFVSHLVTALEAGVDSVVTIPGVASLFTTNLSITIARVTGANDNASGNVGVAIGATDVVLTFSGGFSLTQNDQIRLIEGAVA